MSIRLCQTEQEIPPGYRLADCAVSGGTLEAFLRAALRLTEGKLCLRLVPQRVVFPIPCPQGRGKDLPQEALEALRAAHPWHYSPALLTNYLSFSQQGQLHILLFDTGDTLARKQQLAQALGVPLLLKPSE